MKLFIDRYFTSLYLKLLLKTSKPPRIVVQLIYLWKLIESKVHKNVKTFMQQLNLKQKTVVMGNLWKVTAKRESGKLVKGMSVEIPISERSGIPRAKEIAQAILSKYNIEVGETRCTEIYFEIVKI